MADAFDYYERTKNLVMKKQIVDKQARQMALANRYAEDTYHQRIEELGLMNENKALNNEKLAGSNDLFTDTYDQQVKSAQISNDYNVANTGQVKANTQNLNNNIELFDNTKQDLFAKAGLDNQASRINTANARIDGKSKEQEMRGRVANAGSMFAEKAMQEYPDNPEKWPRAIKAWSEQSGIDPKIWNEMTPENVQQLAAMPKVNISNGSPKFQFGATGALMKDENGYFRERDVMNAVDGSINPQRTYIDGAPVSNMGETVDEKVTTAQRESAAKTLGTATAGRYEEWANDGVDAGSVLLSVQRAMKVGRLIKQGGAATLMENIKGFVGNNDADAAEFFAQTTELALKQLKPLVGNPATDTDADLVRMTVADVKENGVEANERLLGNMLKSVNFRINRGLKASEELGMDLYRNQINDYVNASNTDEHYMLDSPDQDQVPAQQQEVAPSQQQQAPKRIRVNINGDRL